MATRNNTAEVVSIQPFTGATPTAAFLATAAEEAAGSTHEALHVLFSRRI
jgi:hypothetical protein